MPSSNLHKVLISTLTAVMLSCSAGARSEPDERATIAPTGATLENDGIRLADQSRRPHRSPAALDPVLLHRLLDSKQPV